MSERLVITGSTGFIGRQALRYASAFEETDVLVRRPSPPDMFTEWPVGRCCRVHCVDLLDEVAVSHCLGEIEATHLLHLAWHGGPGDRWISPANEKWAAATLALARSFAACGGERMVVAGSCAEYDWGAERFVEGETPLNPQSPYGIAKARAHRSLVTAAASLGLSVAWAHLFFCYGPAEPAGRLVADVIAGVLCGRRVACTAGAQVRDYMHTADIGRALAATVASDLEGDINIASGVGVAVRDMAIAAAAGP